MNSPVVITGLGVVSPIGIGVGKFWEAAVAGRSGVVALSDFEDLPMEGYKSRVAGQITDFDMALVPGAHPERIDRYAQFALVAMKEAIGQARLDMEAEDSRRIGTIVGVAMGGMALGERELTQLHTLRRPSRVPPGFVPGITLNSASGVIAITFGARGPNLTISTACSSSAHAIGEAMLAIRSGRADVVLVAGAEASITPLSFAGFCSLRALSSAYNDSPQKASRPFDRGRDGFVMGEGAGALVLESAEHAARRGATALAAVTGYAATCEAHHMVIPREDGAEVAHAMLLALQDAGRTPGDVDYVNAHATSTTIGDAVEVKAIRSAFGNRADEIAVSATKSLLGHTLGAAGALGGIVCVLSIGSGRIHPTLNYDDPDPDCALGGISRDAQERAVRTALVNSFGFGSNNAALVFEKA